jgi:uncharacterized membrane protein YgaE (UPF0421/DUF939 family)
VEVRNDLSDNVAVAHKLEKTTAKAKSRGERELRARREHFQQERQGTHLFLKTASTNAESSLATRIQELTSR